MIVHRPQPTPVWWLLLVALVVLPLAMQGGSAAVLAGGIWMVIGVRLAWRVRARRRHQASSSGA
jgi:hypothetical protein